METFKVAYILLHFPFLTETFIAEEVFALQSKGVDVQIVSLLEPGKGPVQPLSKQLLPYTRYASELHSISLWKAQVYYLMTRGKLYLNLLFTLLKCPYPPKPLSLFFKRLVIFFKAVAAAYEIREDKPDLLHAHFAWLPGGAAWVMAKLLDIPFSVTIHAYDIYASTDLLELIMSEANHVVAISEYNRQYISDLGYRSAESISVIHCGINVSQFENHRTAEDGQTVKENRVKIISIGSLNHKKGHQFLIEACHILKERNVAFECNIIGTGQKKDELQAQIMQRELTNQVRLLGALPTPEVSKALQQHDIFVLAATVAPNGDRDGIPVVMMEAGAAGLPLVSSHVSGIPEIVVDNSTGFTVAAEDVLALANAIEKLVNAPKLRESFGKNAQNLVYSNFNIDLNTDALKNAFASLTKY